MLRGIYSSVSSMIMLQERQSVITNNLANINTTGYKEEKLLSKSFDEMILSNKDKYINGNPTKQVLGGLSFGVRIDDTITSFHQGTHIETQNNTDFAINGNGFFQVEDINGNQFYTRDGSFKVDSQGYLVTNAGYYVMGINNQTNTSERINVGNSKIVVTPDNNISLDNENLYRFNIVNFGNEEDLDKFGNNVYTGRNPIYTGNFNIKQGYLEGSNVDSIDMTAELMETVKEFEANQKVIQTIDSTLSKIANEIGSIR